MSGLGSKLARRARARSIAAMLHGAASEGSLVGLRPEQARFVAEAMLIALEAEEAAEGMRASLAVRSASVADAAGRLEAMGKLAAREAWRLRDAAYTQGVRIAGAVVVLWWALGVAVRGLGG